jgi:hypothetical protein
MTNWKSFLKNNILEWLLEEDNPSVRYYTLIDLLDKTQDDSEVKNAKDQIMKIGPVPKILEKQNPGGYWFKAEDFYQKTKYKGTVWNFIILAELGADGKDKRIKNTAEFIFKNSQDPMRYGFAHRQSQKVGGLPGGVIPCLTGNMIWSLIRFGYIDDKRVQKGIEWITKYQRFDDKDQDLPKDFPYKAHKGCYGKHSCHMGVIKSLKALTEIPENKRNSEVKNTIKKGVEYLLIHHIYKRSHNLEKVSLPSWLKLSFPHMYQTDILEILDILTKLKYKDDRMNDALKILISKQDNQGKWNLERTFNDRFLVRIENKGKSSKWITLNAIKVLKRYYSS